MRVDICVQIEVFNISEHKFSYLKIENIIKFQYTQGLEVIVGVSIVREPVDGPYYFFLNNKNPVCSGWGSSIPSLNTIAKVRKDETVIQSF